MFLRWVAAIMQSDENFARFKSLYRPPIITNELTESIFSEFEKVFEGENRYEKYDFVDTEFEVDAANYAKRISNREFWPTQGFETFKNSIDNMLVIDLPRLQRDTGGEFISKSDLPEPYYFILDIDDMIDVDNTRVKGTDTMTGEKFYYFKTEYVIYCAYAKGTTREYVYVIDDGHYRIFERFENGIIQFVDEIPHGLTYCPARSFWTTPLNSKTTILKRTIITNSISEMDWLLFFSVARKYLELYAPFPIYAIYKTKCDYKEMGTRRFCQDGWLVLEGAQFDPNNRQRCPKCGHKIKVGPGNVLLINPPRDAQSDPDQMANPMKVIPAERTSLDYMKQAIKDMRDEIYSNCVGKSVAPVINQAQNEDQINRAYESEQAVLLKVKRNFEIIEFFAMDTIFRLRYRDRYLGGTLNYGDIFFYKDENKETEELSKAIETGAPAYEIALRRETVNNARYRNDPDSRERVRILRHLDPFPEYDLKTVMDMKAKSPILVPDDELIIKAKFNAFVDRFEREQTNLLIFGRALDFNRRIALIREEFKAYAKEHGSAAPPPAPTDPPGLPAAA